MIQYLLVFLVDDQLNTRQFIFGFFIILFSIGCTKQYPFHYISLKEIPGIQVLGYGKTKIGNIKHHENMPIRYELKRSQYILFFDLVLQHHNPAVYIRAEKLNSTDLDIEEIEPGTCGYFYNYGFKNQDPRAKVYYWGGAKGDTKCPKDTIDLSKYQEITFRVVDKKGSLLGREKLPFSLIENGITIWTDGI